MGFVDREAVSRMWSLVLSLFELLCVLVFGWVKPSNFCFRYACYVDLGLRL